MEDALDRLMPYVEAMTATGSIIQYRRMKTPRSVLERAPRKRFSASCISLESSI